MPSIWDRWMHGLRPSDRRLLRYVKDQLLPPDFRPEEAWVPSRRIGHAGIDLRREAQLDLLQELRGDVYRSLFDRLRADAAINPGLPDVSYDRSRLLHNGFFPSPDAELYGALVCRHRPGQLIEIGSGYSTLVAREAVRHAELGTRIRVVDPEPRRSVEEAADEVRYERVESSGLRAEDLSPGDLLFIDSSHVTRTGGDLPYLFCELLPRIPENVLVHVHDIFLPYDYPENYWDRFYTEQYLLHALLAGSTKFEVTLGAHYLVRDETEAIRAAISPELGRHPYFFGASFWFRSLR